MRPRLALLAALAAVVALAVPAAAQARLTIAAAPNPISAGDPVLIYGHLDGPDQAGKRVVLWHRIAGRGDGFTPVARTTTDANGFWSIERAAGVVTTNRWWFATARRGIRSRTVAERVRAVVTLDQPTGALVTGRPIAFTGTVSPNHVGQRVILQRQVGEDGDRWRRIDHGRIGPGSRFEIVHRFRRPGERTLRVVFPGDRRNIRGESTPISITINQEQVEGFTIVSSSPSILFGASVTISGTLAGGANTSVTLFAHGQGRVGPHRFRPIAAGTTDADGNYAFVQSPVRNTVYQVRVTSDQQRRTARLFQGVHRVVTIAASATEGQVGDEVAVTGTVQPGRPGHVVFLQRLAGDGTWRTIAVTRLGDGSAYLFAHLLDTPGTEQLRAFVPGGPANQRGVSSAVSIAVSPSPASELPDSELPAAT